MKELTKHLIRRGVLKTAEIVEAFEKIDRKDFVKPDDMKYAYEDHPLSIGYGQTISQPYTVSFMLEILQPRKNDHVLDIGSGSGWTTALLAQIVGVSGSVTGLEIIPELVDFGRKNLKKYNFIHAKINQAKPEILGNPNSHYAKILVSASASAVPKELFEQLSSPGALVVPVKNSICLFKKDLSGRIHTEEYIGFSFVPLV